MPLQSHEFFLGHSLERHDEFAMFLRAEPRRVAFDPHLVGRIGEDDVRQRAICRPGDRRGLTRVAAVKTMGAKPPEISKPRRGRAGYLFMNRVQFIPLGLSRGPRRFQCHVDLREVEACDLDVEADLDQRLKLDRKDLGILAGVLRQTVFGENIGAPLL